VSARYAIDPRRVYVVGFSNGGSMAHRLACEAADRVAAIVSIGGANWKDAGPGRPSGPVAALEGHAGGDGRSARETVATWARRDGCAGPLGLFGAAVPGAETTTERYAGCPAGIDVELWTVHGGRHAPTHPAFGELAWRFLEQHPKPARPAVP